MKIYKDVVVLQNQLTNKQTLYIVPMKWQKESTDILHVIATHYGVECIRDCYSSPVPFANWNIDILEEAFVELLLYVGLDDMANTTPRIIKESILESSSDFVLNRLIYRNIICSYEQMLEKSILDEMKKSNI